MKTTQKHNTAQLIAQGKAITCMDFVNNGCGLRYGDKLFCLKKELGLKYHYDHKNFTYYFDDESIKACRQWLEDENKPKVVNTEDLRTQLHYAHDSAQADVEISLATLF